MYVYKEGSQRLISVEENNYKNYIILFLFLICMITIVSIAINIKNINKNNINLDYYIVRKK